jgi:hypothetical protein
MMNNINNFLKFVNENIDDIHSDIDPYGEEDWIGKSELNIDDLEVLDNGEPQTITHATLALGEYEILCTVCWDDMGFAWSTIDNMEEFPEHVREFIDENNDEIKLFIRNNVR